jgi:hypothetical protein
VANGQEMFSGLMRRVFLYWILFAAATVFLPISGDSREFSRDYSRLVALMGLEDRSEPLYVLLDYQEYFDVGSHQANLQYLNTHPDLTEKIRKDLGGETIRCRLNSLEQRLLFVPELRREYAALYQRYCEDVVSYVIRATRIKNPFCGIQTLLEERPAVPGKGTTVFLVHNLAREYLATYSFVNEQDKEVQISLSGFVESGDVGSYTSDLFLRDDDTVKFVRRNYTIWQNSSRNPYAALIVPAEETLHVVLRESTERAIEEGLKRDSVSNLDDAAKVAEEWMQVEEAVVGGVVNVLMRDFLSGSVPDLSGSLLAGEIEGRKGFQRYKLLEKGIDAVRHMGCSVAIRLYSQNPAWFRQVLMNL